MSPDKKLTPSNEDYLEAVLELSEKNDAVRSVDIAHHLGVSKASVNKAMGILREMNLVEQKLYGQIRLTEQGRHQAQSVLQRHTMLKRFLTDVLHIDSDIADQDACRMEHAISEETRKKWLAWLREVL
jgi:DtxR family transcriptional regulator, Mn-dependent transcriptional regulator